MADVNVTPANIQMGACQVLYDAIDRGATIGGVVFTYTPTYEDFTPDQLTMKIKKMLTGEAAQVTVPLAEYSIDNLGIAIPTGTKTTDDTDPTIQKLEFGGGALDNEDYRELRLVPVTNGSGTISGDANLALTLYKAVAVGAVPIGFAKGGVRVINVTFDCIADTTKDAGKQLGVLGDTAATAA